MKNSELTQKELPQKERLQFDENLRYVENVRSGNDAKEKIVTQSAKHFANKLNHCLDDMDAPISDRERAVILSKMLNIPKHLAWGFLQGHQLPDTDLLQKIASEFDVDTKWLTGEK